MHTEYYYVFYIVHLIRRRTFSPEKEYVTNCALLLYWHLRRNAKQHECIIVLVRTFWTKNVFLVNKSIRRRFVSSVFKRTRERYLCASRPFRQRWWLTKTVRFKYFHLKTLIENFLYDSNLPKDEIDVFFYLSPLFSSPISSCLVNCYDRRSKRIDNDNNTLYLQRIECVRDNARVGFARSIVGYFNHVRNIKVLHFRIYVYS